MDKYEVIRKAVTKATLNGYSSKWMEVRMKPVEGIFNIIFSHSFAKAFWGEKQTPFKVLNNSKSIKMDMDDTIAAYKFHLMEMVICENPIEYLQMFLEEK